MPVLTAEQLQTLGSRILEAAGVSPKEARIVAAELSAANLVGHDSHGVIRLMQYVDNIDNGYIRPGAPFEVVQDLPTLMVVDGHLNFGQVTATKALEAAMEKARQSATATVLIRNCNHVGRLGSYSEKAAREGFASMMAVNAPGPGGVAPFGGMERRLGTNPISMAAPWKEKALVLDMTTSASAEGKLRVAFQKGELVPEGWIIDAAGNPTVDPSTFYADPPGALLPLGGALGFKGFGLSVMIDLFGGILSGSGVCRTDLPRGANGVWMYLLDVSQLVQRDEYDRCLEMYVESIKSSRKLPGIAEILMPGEIEQRRQQERRETGIEIPDETWRQIRELAERLNADWEFSGG